VSSVAQQVSSPKGAQISSINQLRPYAPVLAAAPFAAFVLGAVLRALLG
jgi:hypothetical protein